MLFFLYELQEINVLRSHNITSSGLVSVIDGHKSLQKLKAGDCFLVSCDHVCVLTFRVVSFFFPLFVK